MHQYVGHAKRDLKNKWKNSFFLKYLYKINFRHAVIHHRLTFRRNYKSQFDSDDRKKNLDNYAQKNDFQVISSNYGLKAEKVGFLTYNVITIPFLPIIAITIGYWGMFIAFFIFMLTPLLSMYIHPYLHCDYSESLQKAPKQIVFFIKTPYFKKIICYHFLHHKYPNSNFNLLIGGDWLRGVYRSPSLKCELRAK